MKKKSRRKRLRNKRTRGGNDEPSVYMQVNEQLRAILHILDNTSRFPVLRRVTERLLTLPENNSRYRSELSTYGRMTEDSPNREIRDHGGIIYDLVRPVGNNA